jgi:phosphonate transport system substrate-binding protein
MAPNADDTCRAVAGYLERGLGMPVAFVDDIPWREREAQLDSGDIQLCWLCGLPYIWKADAPVAEIELLAAPVMAAVRYGNQPVYFSDVVVNVASRYTSFADLWGASWAYNEPASHSGYNVVRHHLALMGETRGYFGEAVESGAHQLSLRMIAEGVVDASAIDSTVLEAELARTPELKGVVRVIDTLGPSPMPPWVMRRDLPVALKQSLRDLFLGMSDDAEGKALLQTWDIARFDPAEDAAYDPIRTMFFDALDVRLSAQG